LLFASRRRLEDKGGQRKAEEIRRRAGEASGDPSTFSPKQKARSSSSPHMNKIRPYLGTALVVVVVLIAIKFVKPMLPGSVQNLLP